MLARIVDCNDNHIQEAAERIKNGDLVAFPTETVYGLGARLDDVALAKIFAAKRRPYSDPLICHFDTALHALDYVVLTVEERTLFDKLAFTFWPGPMTLVCKAKPNVPPLVMAGTGNVGVRVPSHPITQKLLQASGEPIAAPSANLFMHVSPTTALHVLNDLNDSDILILDGGSTTIGIESSVLSIVDGRVSVLRPGFVTRADVERLGIEVVVAEHELNAASPGQEARHYSPRLPAVLVRLVETDGQPWPEAAVVIDFNRQLAKWSGRALRYFDMSPVGSIEEAIARLYSLLREAEEVVGAKSCLIADIRGTEQRDRELVASLRDRLWRAAAGHSINLQLD